MTDELAQLSKSVDHIKDTVSTQQSYAGVSTLMEPVHISDLMEDALRMNAGSLSRHNVTVVKDMGGYRRSWRTTPVAVDHGQPDQQRQARHVQPHRPATTDDPGGATTGGQHLADKREGRGRRHPPPKT